MTGTNMEGRSPDPGARPAAREAAGGLTSRITLSDRLLRETHETGGPKMSTMDDAASPKTVAATQHTKVPSVLGELTVVAREGVVIGLYFPHHWYRPDASNFGAYSDCGFEGVRFQIQEYLAGDRQEFEVPTLTEGDEFQERVWAHVRQIPYGETTTYGDLARQLGDGSTPKDVGSAVGKNPLCILAPCHRVLGAGGKLTGYAGGLQRKQYLLDLEAEVAERPNRLF
jgi:methylated-DNA-[protein]-cysteine S-methyltransferase